MSTRPLIQLPQVGIHPDNRGMITYLWLLEITDPVVATRTEHQDQVCIGQQVRAAGSSAQDTHERIQRPSNSSTIPDRYDDRHVECRRECFQCPLALVVEQPASRHDQRLLRLGQHRRDPVDLHRTWEALGIGNGSMNLNRADRHLRFLYV